MFEEHAARWPAPRSVLRPNRKTEADRQVISDRIYVVRDIGAIHRTKPRLGRTLSRLGMVAPYLQKPC